MRPEYDLDYRQARPNRFAPRMQNAVAVVLEPDVATVFKTSESVNAMLRSVIAAYPEPVRNASGPKRRKQSG